MKRIKRLTVDFQGTSTDDVLQQLTDQGVIWTLHMGNTGVHLFSIILEDRPNREYVIRNPIDVREGVAECLHNLANNRADVDVVVL